MSAIQSRWEGKQTLKKPHSADLILLSVPKKFSLKFNGHIEVTQQISIRKKAAVLISNDSDNLIGADKKHWSW